MPGPRPSSSRAGRSPARHTLNAVDFRVTSSIAAGTTLTATGSTTLTAGALNGTGTLAAQGSISQASGFTGGTATLLVNGAGAQTLTGASTTAAGDLPVLVINKPSGTLTLAGTIRTTHSWTYTGWHARCRDLDRRLRRRHGHRLAHPQRRRRPGDHDRSPRARR